MKNLPTSFHFPTQRLLELRYLVHFQQNKKGKVISFSSRHLWRIPGYVTYFIFNIIYCSTLMQEKSEGMDLNIFISNTLLNHKNVLESIYIYISTRNRLHKIDNFLHTFQAESKSHV